MSAAVPLDPYLDPRGHRPFLGDGGADLSPCLAATADVLKVYEEAVQEPEVECANLDGLYAGAQLDDTDIPEARILREDFCSSAIVASTWLSLRPTNVSQGVDIDLSALRDTQRRLGSNTVRVLQSPAFGEEGRTSEIPPQTIEDLGSLQLSTGCPDLEKPSGSSIRSTWDLGATSDRFERRFQARQAKEVAKAARLAAANAHTPVGPRLTLLHSDVIDLPVPPTSATASPEPPSSSALQPPDLIASLNYALCYFHSRSALLAYLRVAVRTLRPRSGVLVADLFGGPPTGETYEDQAPLWDRFGKELGFDASPRDLRGVAGSRSGGADARRPSNASRRSSAHTNGRAFGTPALNVHPVPLPGTEGTPGEWPRGKLKLVRTGKAHGGFEYWREDGPVDYLSNRFRMSLSFRFNDASWLRDVFSYDFRIWSVKEITEALEEVGFVRVSVHVLPRNIVDDDDSSDISGDEAEEGVGEADGDGGGSGFASFIARTEREEAGRCTYRKVRAGEKLFAESSFSTYIVACAP